MNKLFKQYIETIEEKTLFIYCNDCFVMKNLESNGNIIGYNLFGSKLNQADPFVFDYFEHCVHSEGVTRIIFSGHYGCEILKYLNEDDSNYAHGKFLDSNRFEGNQLGELALQRQLIYNNINEQVERLSNVEYFKEKLSANEITINGVIIEDSRILDVNKSGVAIKQCN